MACVRVQACPAASRAGIWLGKTRLTSGGDEDKKEQEQAQEEEERMKEEGGEEGGGVAPLLKSRDPHLAGGEEHSYRVGPHS